LEDVHNGRITRVDGLRWVDQDVLNAGSSQLDEERVLRFGRSEVMDQR
jgi:hypothetical protein